MLQNPEIKVGFGTFRAFLIFYFKTNILSKMYPLFKKYTQKKPQTELILMLMSL